MKVLLFSVVVLLALFFLWPLSVSLAQQKDPCSTHLDRAQRHINIANDSGWHKTVTKALRDSNSALYDYLRCKELR